MFSSKSPPKLEMFVQYPITNVEHIKQEADLLGIKALYIGKAKDMTSYPQWEALAGQLTVLDDHKFYDPDVYLRGIGYSGNLKSLFFKPEPYNISTHRWLPTAHILVVRYGNDLYQCAQLQFSNNIRDAIDFITPYKVDGVPVDGLYEELRTITAISWQAIVAFIFCAIVVFTIFAFVFQESIF